MQFCGSLLLVSSLLAPVFVSRAAAYDADGALADELTLRSASLGADGLSLLEFFRHRATSRVEAGRLTALVRDLGDKSPQAREQAAAQLVGLGPLAIAALRLAARDADDLDRAAAARRCLQAIEVRG